MSDPKNIEGSPICPYCLIEFNEQYDVDDHIANDQCEVKKPTLYEKELLERVMRQDSLIYALKTGMNTIFNEKMNEVVAEAMKLNQTTNYNLNVICLNTNNLISQLEDKSDVTPCKTLSMEDLMSETSLPFYSNQGGEN